MTEEIKSPSLEEIIMAQPLITEELLNRKIWKTVYRRDGKIYDEFGNYIKDADTIEFDSPYNCCKGFCVK